MFWETFHAPSNETDVNMIGIIRQKGKGMSVQNLATKEAGKNLYPVECEYIHYVYTNTTINVRKFTKEVFSVPGFVLMLWSRDCVLPSCSFE